MVSCGIYFGEPGVGDIAQTVRREKGGICRRTQLLVLK